MKNLLAVALLTVALTGFQSNCSSTYQPIEKPRLNRVISDEDELPKAIRPMWYAVNGGFTQNSSKWRALLIEQRFVVEVIKNTAEYHSNEIITQTSEWVSLRGASSFSLTSKVSLENEYSIVTTEQITVSGEATLGVGAKVDGFGASAELKAQASYTSGKTTTYSTKYSKDSSITVNYNIADIPNVDNNTKIASCIAGDYIKGQARIKKIAYWWWGTEIVEDWRSFDFQIVTNSYRTYCLSNGWFAGCE